MTETTTGVELDALTGVQRQRLRHAIRDVGVGIYRNPMLAPSVSAVGRYLSEGGTLLPELHWHVVWRCVTALCEREPYLLDGPAPTQAFVAERCRIRREQAEALLHEAAEAFDTGTDPDTALALIDRAELASPDCPLPGRDYADLRQFVRRQAAFAATRPADLPDVPPLKSSHECRRCRRWLEGEWSDADAAQRTNLERQMGAGRCDDCTRREAAGASA